MKRKRRGAALIIAIGYLTIVTTFATAYLAGVNRSIGSIHRAERIDIARALAEAGVARAILKLETNPDYAGEKNLALGEGKITIRVERMDDGWHIESTGTLMRNNVPWPQRLEAQVVGNGRVISWTWVKAT